MSDRWAKIVGFFTIVGAIAALLVVPELREATGLPPLSEAHKDIKERLQSPTTSSGALANAAPQSRPANDVSDTYGNANGTIFNKKTLVVFATPEEFFRDSGRTSFAGLIFDNVSRLPDDAVMVDGRRVIPPQSRENGKGRR